MRASPLSLLVLAASFVPVSLAAVAGGRAQLRSSRGASAAGLLSAAGAGAGAGWFGHCNAEGNGCGPEEPVGACCDPHLLWCESIKQAGVVFPLAPLQRKCVNPLKEPRWLLENEHRIPALGVSKAVVQGLADGKISEPVVQALRSAVKDRTLVAEDFPELRTWHDVECRGKSQGAACETAKFAGKCRAVALFLDDKLHCVAVTDPACAGKIVAESCDAPIFAGGKEVLGGAVPGKCQEDAAGTLACRQVSDMACKGRSAGDKCAAGAIVVEHGKLVPPAKTSPGTCQPFNHMLLCSINP
jgi:hypothetical protein